jgi:hypothetical protein
MDIETDRTPQNASHTSSGPCGTDLQTGSPGDSMPGSPNGDNHDRMICRPSARAIADAIIRRAVAEVRG